MKRAFLPFLRMIACLTAVLLFYFCFRIAFYAFNAASFPHLSGGALAALFFKGLRFDVSAVFMVNLLFIFLTLFPLNLWRYQAYRRLLRVVFLCANGIAFLFEIADWAYFPFNHKRSTAEVLDIVTTKGDFFNLLPGFFRDYWYIFFIALFVLVLLSWIYRSIERYFLRKEALLRVLGRQSSPAWSNFVLRFLLLVLGSGLTVIGIRGGLQYVPISIRSAVVVTRSEYTPIVLNTPFSIIKSVAKPHLEERHYMPEAEAVALLQPVKYYGSASDTFRPDNVVFIILESFSKEFTGLVDGKKSYTPFLDSLMGCSLTFTNAYANGLHSAEGIPALLGGIPSLMDGYYTLSAYSNNRIDAVPFLLKKMGYRTAFYHGGTNGTMGFDNFASAAGFSHYYGRTEYNNDKDYDGNWGIYDEPFLQYFAHGLDTMKQPFMAAVFTLTSHPPYPMPLQYEGKFPGGDLAIYPDIGYTDMAVRKFFAAIKDKPWFRHTLFVISPDHCSPLASDDYYASGTGRYQIPIIFYAPGDTALRGTCHRLIQQIDVLPSVMDYLHYPDSFFSLGNSIFRPEAPRFVINRLGGVYDWMNGGYQSFISDDRVLEAYAFPQDSLRRHDLAGDKDFRLNKDSHQLFRAFVQIYNQALIKNRMTARNFTSFLQQHKTAGNR